MPVKQICLDLDGVLCDFVGPTLKLFKRDPDAMIADWPAGNYDMPAVLGISTNELWEAVDKAGFRHWADLPKLSWADELLKLCRSIAPTIILTSPTLHVSSLSGKMNWLQRHYGKHFRDYLIGPSKHACAIPGSVLIDDCDANCDRFTCEGGFGVVFPQPWNRFHELACGDGEARIEHVRRAIDRVANMEQLAGEAVAGAA
jgi:5'(3')-deoxyribonucleotidase